MFLIVAFPPAQCPAVHPRLKNASNPMAVEDGTSTLAIPLTIRVDEFHTGTRIALQHDICPTALPPKAHAFQRFRRPDTGLPGLLLDSISTSGESR